MAYLIDDDLRESPSENFMAHFAQINRLALASGSPIEGNIFYLNHRRMPDTSVIRNNVITNDFLEKRHNFCLAVMGKKHLLEIGFNAGHSALLALEANPELTYWGIDIARYKYTRPCAAYLRARYGKRFNIFFGSSVDVVPEFSRRPVASRIDLVHVDGGHVLAIASVDLTNVLRMPKARSVHRHLLVDDTARGEIRRSLVGLVNTSNIVSERYGGLWRGSANLCFRILDAPAPARPAEATERLPASPAEAAAPEPEPPAAAGDAPTREPAATEHAPARTTRAAGRTLPAIFQFWDRDPPDEITELLDTWRKETAFRYELFDDAAASAFIRKQVGATAAAAYGQCNVPAMKADFFRYCALYARGGVYIDADTRNLGGLADLYASVDRGLLFLRKNNVANDFMIVKRAKDPLMRYAIDTAMANIKARASNNVWEVTGPGILTGAYGNASGGHAKLFEGYAILPVKDIKKVVGFKWDLDYKNRETHWTKQSAAKDGGTIYKDAGAGTR